MKHVLGYPADALVLSSKALTRKMNDCMSHTSAFMDNASLSAKFYPYEADTGSFVIRDSVAGNAETTDDGLPVPRGRELTLLSVTPEADGHQSAVLLSQ